MSENFLPVNVGFGIPYVLPLVVELLISNQNSLLLIEIDIAGGENGFIF